jgi:hypothetical protein
MLRAAGAVRGNVVDCDAVASIVSMGTIITHYALAGILVECRRHVDLVRGHSPGPMPLCIDFSKTSTLSMCREVLRAAPVFWDMAGDRIFEVAAF